MGVTPKDISVFGNLSQSDIDALSPKEKEFARIAQELDVRFLSQFERREFVFEYAAEKMKSYLPEGLHDDGNLVKDQQVKISYNYWSARNNPETAPTIIGLGGIYNSARRFDFLAEGAAENFNFIALDYPGKGHSGNLRMPNDYTLDTYAAIVEKLIEQENLSAGYHLVGHSHGSKVIYTMVEKGFEDANWKGTIIGDMPPETPEGPKLRRAWRNRERPFSETMEEAVRKLTSFLQGHGAPVSGDFIIHDFNHGFAYYTRDGFGWAYDPNSMTGYADEYLQPYDKWQAYKDIPTPILILAGEKSNTATPEAVKRMLDERPDASIFLYEGVGHYPELVTGKRIAEVVNWAKDAAGNVSQRAIVPADPEEDMKIVIRQDNNPVKAKPAPKKRVTPGSAM